MKKRLLSLLVSLCLLLSVFPVSASAASYSGSCGKNVNYSLVNGVMTISGTGAMERFAPTTVPWRGLSGRNSVRCNKRRSNDGRFLFFFSMRKPNQCNSPQHIEGGSRRFLPRMHKADGYYVAGWPGRAMGCGIFIFWNSTHCCSRQRNVDASGFIGCMPGTHLSCNWYRSYGTAIPYLCRQ